MINEINRQDFEKGLGELHKRSKVKEAEIKDAEKILEEMRLHTHSASELENFNAKELNSLKLESNSAQLSELEYKKQILFLNKLLNFKKKEIEYNNLKLKFETNFYELMLKEQERADIKIQKYKTNYMKNDSTTSEYSIKMEDDLNFLPTQSETISLMTHCRNKIEKLGEDVEILKFESSNNNIYQSAKLESRISEISAETDMYKERTDAYVQDLRQTLIAAQSKRNQMSAQLAILEGRDKNARSECDEFNHFDFE